MDSRAGWGAAGWTGAFLAAGWILARLGRLEWLLIDWSDPLGWLQASEIEVALAALGRLMALTLLGWIGLSTLVYTAARLTGMEAKSLDWLSIGPFRRAVDALLAGYLLLGSMSPAGALVDDPVPPASSRQEAVDPGYIPVPAGSTSERNAPPPERRQEEESGEPSENRAVVSSGDHLWKLAAERMEEALGRAPTDAEVAPYWVQVVEANRDRIRSGDPDLIFPGEEIVLPPLPD